MYVNIYKNILVWIATAPRFLSGAAASTRVHPVLMLLEGQVPHLWVLPQKLTWQAQTSRGSHSNPSMATGWLAGYVASRVGASGGQLEAHGLSPKLG